MRAGGESVEDQMQKFMESFDAKRDRELQCADLQAMEGHTVKHATINPRHIAIDMNNGWSYRFYGFLEAIPPGQSSLLDPSERDDSS